MDDRLQAEIKRIDERFQDFRATQSSERDLLGRQLVEYKDFVRDKLSEMNAMRSQISEERGQFELREHAEAQLVSINERVDRGLDVLTDRINRIEQSIANINGRLMGMGAALTIIMFLMNIAFQAWKKG